MSLSFPLHDPDFYRGDPFPAHAQLRRESSVHWHEAGGFWVLARYEEVRQVSRDPETFSSREGIIMPDPQRDTSRAPLDLLITTDPPTHRRMRQLIRQSFVPREVRRLEPRLRELATRVLDAIEPGAVLGFAKVVAAPFPTLVIAELIGVPGEDWERFRAWSDAFAAYQDPEQELDANTAALALHGYFLQSIEDHRKRPRHDLISILLDAEIDGAKLTTEEIYAFCWLLLTAGNETTRNLISLGTCALLRYPDQLRRFVEKPEIIPLAVEEMLRWCNPVTHMMRTATRDVELCGQRIRKEQYVVLLYGSANRDESVFGADAERFDIGRDPNPHIAFGVGEHVCIGAALARLEARVLFEGLRPWLSRMEFAGEVTRVRSTMVPGVRHIPVRLAA